MVITRRVLCLRDSVTLTRLVIHRVETYIIRHCAPDVISSDTHPSPNGGVGGETMGRRVVRSRLVVMNGHNLRCQVMKAPNHHHLHLGSPSCRLLINGYWAQASLTCSCAVGQHHHPTASPSVPSGWNDAPAPSPASSHALRPLQPPPSPWLTALPPIHQRISTKFLEQNWNVVGVGAAVRTALVVMNGPYLTCSTLEESYHTHQPRG